MEATKVMTVLVYLRGRGDRRMRGMEYAKVMMCLNTSGREE